MMRGNYFDNICVDKNSFNNWLHFENNCVDNLFADFSKPDVAQMIISD